MVPAVAAKFPWPKSMRWGSGKTTWVRPLHSIVCLLDGKVVPFAIEDVESGKQTRGHRFHGNEPFEVKGSADYVKALRGHKVILDAAERAALIAEQARALAKEHKLALVEDEALLAENAGLTEWPTVLMGSFEEAFLERAGRVPDAVHEAAPEVLLAEAPALGQARQQVPAGLEPARQGRRQGRSSPATRR